MALHMNSPLPTKSPLHPHQPLLPLRPSSIPIPRRAVAPISAVHSAEHSPAPATAPARPDRWSVDSWKAKKALQLPEYPNAAKLDEVLKTIERFPPIVFAGEARHLEERLSHAAMGRAFLLMGGDCAESFKEFHANNIRDTFRILLQMAAVLMFGSQMPVIKVTVS